MRGCLAPANVRVNLQVFYQHAPPTPPSPPLPPPPPPHEPHDVTTLSGPSASKSTWIRSTQPATVQPDTATHVIWWDGNTQDEGNRDYVLLWFDLTNIDASRVETASLTYNVAGSSNTHGNMGELHELSLPWDMDVTYASLPYSPTGERGGESESYGPAVHHMPCAAGLHTIDVTHSVRAWTTGDLVNHGWIVVPSFSDGCGIQSHLSELDNGPPKLTINLITTPRPPPPPTPPPPPPAPPAATAQPVAADRAPPGAQSADGDRG